MTDSYIYEKRAVAFLDVLGFKEKLREFEEEASLFMKEERDLAFDNLDKGQSMVSLKANEFINTFLSAISILDEEQYQYYLFSDNICITAKQVTSKQVLIDMLNVIADLFYAFAQKGYFLRGGIDFGNFIDQDKIALGMPLANAYKMEQDDAVYPRIIISEKLREEIDTIEDTSAKAYINNLIKKSCEVYYLNTFLQVLKTDDKETFFTELSTVIKKNLVENNKKEKVFVKFEWLANEFNSFIENYLQDLVYRDENFEPDHIFIETIRSLKIVQHAD